MDSKHAVQILGCLEKCVDSESLKISKLPSSVSLVEEQELTFDLLCSLFGSIQLDTFDQEKARLLPSLVDLIYEPLSWWEKAKLSKKDLENKFQNCFYSSFLSRRIALVKSSLDESKIETWKQELECYPSSDLKSFSQFLGLEEREAEKLWLDKKSEIEKQAELEILEIRNKMQKRKQKLDDKFQKDMSPNRKSRSFIEQIYLTRKVEEDGIAGGVNPFRHDKKQKFNFDEVE